MDPAGSPEPEMLQTWLDISLDDNYNDKHIHYRFDTIQVLLTVRRNLSGHRFHGIVAYFSYINDKR